MKPLRAVLALSGGVDSTALLLNLLANDYEVIALSFDYGQKHIVEVHKAYELVQYLDKQGYNKRIPKHRIVNLTTISDLLNLSFEEDNIFTPNIDKIFLSILQAVALSLSVQVNAEVKIALSVHVNGLNVHPSQDQEFIGYDYKSFLLANKNAEKVSYLRPFENMDKYGILVDAELSCERLGISFEEVFKRTHTSLIPIKHNNIAYNDYRSESAKKRIQSFVELGRPDPALYADDYSPVPWEIVKEYINN